jgi:hypothetical protein
MLSVFSVVNKDALIQGKSQWPKLRASVILRALPA